MKTALINLYEFNELSADAKEKAINEHRDFLESLPQELEDEAGELKKYYDMEYSDEEVSESIEANKYIFFSNGEMSNCITYTGKHPKTGTTEFKLFGETYNI